MITHTHTVRVLCSSSTSRCLTTYVKMIHNTVKQWNDVKVERKEKTGKEKERDGEFFKCFCFFLLNYST